MIKTSKIAEVHKMTPWDGPNGTIIYHWLLMENGDMIDIGKKKECKVGWDITYQITDTQHKYNKAKAEQPQEGTPAATAIQENIKRKDDNLKGIKIGHAITNAVNLLVGSKFDYSDTSKAEGVIKAYAKMILKISEELENEPEDVKPEPIPMAPVLKSRERPNTTSTLENMSDSLETTISEEDDLPF